MQDQNYLDWGEVSEKFDSIKNEAFNKELNNESEAQTRFDIIDRIIKEVLQWKHGQISVEEYSKGEAKEGYVDYLLKCGDFKIIVEAKKIGMSFPNPTKRKKLKLTGSMLSEGFIGEAIRQAESYAKTKEANIVIVTNGSCWCFYPLEAIERDLIYAYLLFPFEDIKDSEALYDFFAIPKVEQGSLSKLSYENPRDFIYESLKEFTLNEHPYVKTDYKSLIEPAYSEEIKKIARGPYGLMAKNKQRFEEKIQEIIEDDYKNVEPYVDKILSYISKNHLCVIVLDNIDLYENSKLEIDVFSEGVALSKKINCNIIVSIRDTTYVKHKNDSIFNAYELKKFWIDPPNFREVLSKRLKFASLALKNKKATIPYSNMSLTIEDLSVFFDIAHSTLLQEKSARLIECIADGNIRKGITLVSNFLTSAHIQADRALYNYLNKQVVKNLPFHEVFKGTMLGPWKHYKEERAEVINILNSGFNSKILQLLRSYVLKFLFYRAKDKNNIETSFAKIFETFSNVAASENHLLKVLSDLYQNRLINTIDSKNIDASSIIVITLSGGYYYNYLLKQFEYLESVMFDTPILIDFYWENLVPLNEEIQHENNIIWRVALRKERALLFFDYLKKIEEEGILQTSLALYSITSEIEIPLNRKLQYVLSNAKDFYS